MNLTLCLYSFPEIFYVEREPSERGFHIHPQAFFCPVCLRTWAEIVVEGRPWTFDLKQVNVISCEGCFRPTFIGPDYLFEVPGSLLDNQNLSGGFDEGLLEVLPELLLRREFELTLKAFSHE